MREPQALTSEPDGSRRPQRPAQYAAMRLIRFLGWVDGQLPKSRSRVRASSSVSDYPVTSYDGTVASRAGAWIETNRAAERWQHERVASRAGAWIETSWCCISGRGDPGGSLPARGRGLKHRERLQRGEAGRSLPARGRGLKPVAVPLPAPPRRVASRAGAWIETTPTIRPCRGSSSLPARGRGLKPFWGAPVPAACESLPARGRGLKLLPWHKCVDRGASLPARGCIPSE